MVTPPLMMAFEEKTGRIFPMSVESQVGICPSIYREFNANRRKIIIIGGDEWASGKSTWP
jgi:hypothetical protein